MLPLSVTPLVDWLFPEYRVMSLHWYAGSNGPCQDHVNNYRVRRWKFYDPNLLCKIWVGLISIQRMLKSRRSSVSVFTESVFEVSSSVSSESPFTPRPETSSRDGTRLPFRQHSLTHKRIHTHIHVWRCDVSPVSCRSFWLSYFFMHSSYLYSFLTERVQSTPVNEK